LLWTGGGEPIYCHGPRDSIITVGKAVKLNAVCCVEKDLKKGE